MCVFPYRHPVWNRSMWLSRTEIHCLGLEILSTRDNLFSFTGYYRLFVCKQTKESSFGFTLTNLFIIIWWFSFSYPSLMTRLDKLECSFVYIWRYSLVCLYLLLLICSSKDSSSEHFISFTFSLPVKFVCKTRLCVLDTDII